MATQAFYEALKLFKSSVQPFYGKGVPASYLSYITAIQTALDLAPSSPQLLEDWILPQIKTKGVSSPSGLVDNVLDEFNRAFGHVNKIGSRRKSDCRSALIAFTKFILGQYKSDLYLAIDQRSDEANCRLVARNALFCTIDVADKIKKGDLGSKLNKKHPGGVGKGNMYYSWFCYGFQRMTIGQKRRTHVTIPSGMPDPEGILGYVLDDNSMANQAIKNAVIAGFPSWMKSGFNSFENYMACHIWDKTCYDYRYHTSVFNIVLLPTSIGGLTDYCPAVKELLQVESAMRFGVYPEVCSFSMSREIKSIYNKLHEEWRQPDEHAIAAKNVKSKLNPTAI